GRQSSLAALQHRTNALSSRSESGRVGVPGYFTRFHVASAVVPVDVEGLLYFSSSGGSGTISRFCSAPPRVGKNVFLNARDHRFIGLVDGIGAETGDKSRQDSLVFLRGALIYALGRELGNIRPRNELRETSVCVEYEDALGVGPPAVTLGTVWFYVERGNECPGTYDLLFERFLLAQSVARQKRESQRSDYSKTKDVTPIHRKPP